jgi:Carboxypeptidase regulatory-like domain
VSGAKITVTNVTTGQSAEAQSDSAGKYELKNLAPGDYEISVAAAGFSPKTEKITIAQRAAQTLNLALLMPSTNVAAPNLSELGFPSSEMKPNPQEQARLDKRSHMLKIHQRLGLITARPLVATVITGTFAGGRKTTSTDRDVHAALGSATAGLYFSTAYFSIFAPKVPGTQTHGMIRLHKTLAWIHGPGMVLTPILGAMAFDQKSRGEKVHGIASAHGAVGIVTAAAYGAAITSVSVKF